MERKERGGSLSPAMVAAPPAAAITAAPPPAMYTHTGNFLNQANNPFPGSILAVAINGGLTGTGVAGGLIPGFGLLAIVAATAGACTAGFATGGLIAEVILETKLGFSAAGAAPIAAAQDLAPTIPSAVNACAFCHATVLLWVPGPKLPSAVTPITFCHFLTASPFEPCLIVGYHVALVAAAC